MRTMHNLHIVTNWEQDYQENCAPLYNCLAPTVCSTSVHVIVYNSVYYNLQERVRMGN